MAVASLVGMLAFLVFAAPAPALQFGAPLRITHIGVDGDTSRSTLRPTVAWGAANEGRFLVAFEGDGLGTNNDIEIFARLLDAGGAALTGDVRLSVTGVEDTTSEQAAFPDVAYNPVSGDFFVVWDAELTGTTQREIMLVRVPSSGAAPSAQVQISDDNGASGFTPAIAVDPASGAMLVAWSDQRAPHSGLNDEAYVQRLDANGAEVGGDVRISEKNSAPFNGRVFYPDLAWNAALGRWLVAWQYNGGDGAGYFQMLDAAASQIGPDDGVFAPLPGAEPAVASAEAAGWQLAATTVGGVAAWRIAADGTPAGPGPLLTGGAANLGRDGATGGYLLATSGLNVPTLELAPDGSATGAMAPAGLPGTGPSPDLALDAVNRRWLVVGVGPAAGTSELEVNGVFSGAAAAPPAPSPAPVPAPQPTAAPVTEPSPAPKLASLATLPSTRKCVSRRSFRIRLREPKGVQIAEARVFVNGRRVKTVKGVRRTANVDLRGLPKGRFTVKIELRTADGRKVTGTRRYRTCAPKRKGGSGPKV